MVNIQTNFFSNHCGLGDTAHLPNQHAIDAVCKKHDEYYQRYMDAGKDPYLYFNYGDKIFQQDLAATQPKSTREYIVKWGSQLYANLKELTFSNLPEDTQDPNFQTPAKKQRTDKPRISPMVKKRLRSADDDDDGDDYQRRPAPRLPELDNRPANDPDTGMELQGSDSKSAKGKRGQETKPDKLPYCLWWIHDSENVRLRQRYDNIDFIVNGNQWEPPHKWKIDMTSQSGHLLDYTGPAAPSGQNGNLTRRLYNDTYWPTLYKKYCVLHTEWKFDGVVQLVYRKDDTWSPVEEVATDTNNSGGTGTNVITKYGTSYHAGTMKAACFVRYETTANPVPTQYPYTTPTTTMEFVEYLDQDHDELITFECNPFVGHTSLNINGSYKSGQHTREVSEDTEAEIWTTTGEHPNLHEYLNLIFVRTPESINSGNVGIRIKGSFTMDKIVQFKELQPIYHNPHPGIALPARTFMVKDSIAAP